MLPLSPQSYKLALLKSARFTLYRKYFLNGLLRQGTDKNKTGEVWLL